MGLLAIPMLLWGLPFVHYWFWALSDGDFWRLGFLFGPAPASFGLLMALGAILPTGAPRTNALTAAVMLFLICSLTFLVFSIRWGPRG